MAKKEDEHPLRVEDVLERAGITPRLPDHAWELTCDACGARQSLRDASLELAEDPNDITAYRCMNGCMIVAVTGYPSPVPLPGRGRYRLKDYIFQPLTRSGWIVDPTKI